jgi:hypothetical protein
MRTGIERNGRGLAAALFVGNLEVKPVSKTLPSVTFGLGFLCSEVGISGWPRILFFLFYLKRSSS